MAKYECDRCGACCVHLIIEIDEVDVAREPRLKVAKPFRAEERDFETEEEAEECARVGPLVPGFEAGALLACGEPCPLLGPDNLCQIYPTRPTCCVAVQAGSDRCQDARRMAGLPPLAGTEGG